MAEQNDETANFEISITPEGNQLVLTPDRELTDVVVHGNEILVAGHRLVFQLSSEKRPASPSLEELIPVLYLLGVSTGDFSEALSALLGEQPEGFSANTVVRLKLKEKWSKEHEARSTLSLPCGC